jgi:hypothetical protein
MTQMSAKACARVEGDVTGPYLVLLLAGTPSERGLDPISRRAIERLRYPKNLKIV